MNYLASFFSHARALQDASAALGVEASIRLSDFGLSVGEGRHDQRWRPKFMANAGDRLVYTDRPAPGMVGFAGWLPYQTRRWPIAQDKSAFKRHAIAHGLQTPAACFDPARIGGPFIIKKTRSSFGEGMRGPFLRFDGNAVAHVLAEGEYYENFIVGNIAKAWCLADKCVALNLHPPSLVTGDGRATLRELVLQLPNSRGSDNDWGVIGRLARYCGIASVESVVAPGKEVLIEYRYGSRYEMQSFDNDNLMPRLQDGALGQQFSRAAAICAREIPDDDAGPALYTLDAMVDSEGTAWFLEMNCNPLVHPDAYQHMLPHYAGASNTGPRPEDTTPATEPTPSPA